MCSPKVRSSRLFGAGLPGPRTLIGIVLVASVPLASWAVPVVTNVEAGQRTDGSKLVDVMYDLAGGVEPMTVSIVFSTDDGATWGRGSPTGLESISSGTRGRIGRASSRPRPGPR